MGKIEAVLQESNIKKMLNHAKHFQQLIHVGQFINSANSFIVFVFHSVNP